jgi:endonuclease/exonuclease/phosphatase family metal-dependent hydrolase
MRHWDELRFGERIPAMSRFRDLRLLILGSLIALGCDQRFQEHTQTIRPGGTPSGPVAETSDSGHQVVAPNSNAYRPNPAKQTPANPASTVRDGWTPIPIPNVGSPAFETTAREYLFCFWNVENLFDDVNDGRTGQGDKEYDPWLANHPDILKLKLSKLADALLAMNGGKGPDILALAEVESVRAAQLLQYTLNARISDPELHYRNVLMKEVKVGRHIAPAILTRLPVVADRTRHVGTSAQRILEGHIVVEGRELIVIASHWTSRLREENTRQRGEYGDKIYGECNAIWHANPNADILICGDFNDNPTDVSVTQHLHATGDLNRVRNSSSLSLFNLFADKSATSGFGTEYERGWNIFDQIVVSPGMIDGHAWNVEPDTLQVGNHLAQPGERLHKPWRFGGERDSGPRGYSDHFPVMVKLRLNR